MEVRKFWLVNSKGDKYEMTNRALNHFFNSPSGLGFVKNYGVTRLGNEDIITAQQFQLMTVRGEMIFKGGVAVAYEEYQNFMSFIRHEPIKLHYQPANVLTSYYSNVLVVQLDKSEVNASDGAMHCPLYIKCNSHWLTANERNVSVSNQTVGDGKEYPLTRPYHYSGSTLANIEVNNDGSDEVGFMLEIVGKVHNPQLTISQNGARYGIVKLLGEFDYAKIDSVDSEEEIYLENNGSTLTNPVAYQDLSVADGNSYVTFVKLKTGKSNLVFTYSGEFSGYIAIRWRDSYVSV